MVATPNYTALDGIKNGKEKMELRYVQKKITICISTAHCQIELYNIYVRYFVIFVTGNWITKVFLYQRNEMEFFIMINCVVI